MRIQCENCRTLFNLDETLLKEGGSRVKCSVCGYVFKAYPSPGEGEDDVAVDTPLTPVQDEKETVEALASVGEPPAAPDFQGKDEAFEADLDSIYKDAFDGEALDRQEMDDIVFEEGGDAGEEGPETERIDAPKIHEKEVPGDGRPASAKKSSSRGGKLTILLVILLFVVGGAAGITYWKPDLLPSSLGFLKRKAPAKKKPADPGVRLLQFESVAGSFVDSEKNGQLFVIRGKVQSKYPEPRSYMLVKGTILDDKGKMVESRVSYAGNTFTEEELKTLPLDEIRKAMQNRQGMARQNVNVPSGAGIPFMIVFDNLPDNLSEFAVEAVSSSPGA